MKDYKILVSDDSLNLANIVIAHLQDGWILQGGVAFAMGTFGQQYSQAMVYPS